MAAGKTTIGKNLARALQYNFLDLDNVIEQQENKTISDIFNTKGEAYFRTLEHETLHKTTAYENAVISCGGGTPCYFDNINFILSNGLCIWIKAPVQYISSRIAKAKNKRPLLNGLTNEALLQHIEKQLVERTPYYKQANFTYDNSVDKMEDLLLKIKNIQLTNT
jgi:shikimate kinase